MHANFPGEARPAYLEVSGPASELPDSDGAPPAGERTASAQRSAAVGKAAATGALPWCAPSSSSSSSPAVPSEDARPCLSIAPMMAWTDHHYRQLVRLLTRRTLLFTEMIPAADVLAAQARGPEALHALLRFDPSQRPIAVQLGGYDPETLACAAALCADAGYDEINLNVGCPSASVNSYRSGLCLMKEPEQVRAICAAIRRRLDEDAAAADARGDASSRRPRVTVKHRLGVDDRDSFEELVEFVETVASAPACVTHFVVHARKGLLGLDTVQNRMIPPIRHDWVFRLAARFPELTFELNGEVGSLDHARQLLSRGYEASADAGHTAVPKRNHFGGVLVGIMVGRMAYHAPWRLASADAHLFGCSNPGLSRRSVLERYLAYADETYERLHAEAEQLEKLNHRALAKQEARAALIRPLQHLFSDDPCGDEFTRKLAKGVAAKQSVRKTVLSAMRSVPDDFLDATPPSPLLPPEAAAAASAGCASAAPAA